MFSSLISSPKRIFCDRLKFATNCAKIKHTGSQAREIVRYRMQLWIQDSRNFLRSVADDMGVKLSANMGGVKLSDVRSVKLYQPWGYHSQSDIWWKLCFDNVDSIGNFENLLQVWKFWKLLTGQDNKSNNRTMTKTIWGTCDLWGTGYNSDNWLNLRTWIHDNLCAMTIRSETGQHSQFWQCLLLDIRASNICYCC